MEYTVEVMMDFTDIHSKEKYFKGKQLIVSEERALELFSSNNHLVKFIKRENVINDDQIDNVQDEKNTTPQNNDDLNENGDNPREDTQIVSDELDTMNFKQLLDLAKEKGLDTNQANSKDKLKALIRSSEK